MGKIDDDRKQRTEAAAAARIEALTTAAGSAVEGTLPLASARVVVAAVLAEVENQVTAHADLLAANKAAGWKSEHAVFLKAAPLFGSWAAEMRAAFDADPADVVIPANASASDVEAFLRDDIEVGDLPDAGPSIGGYVTPERAREIRESSQEVEVPQVPVPMQVPVMVELAAPVRRDRLTYPQFLQIAVAAPDPEHWSHSSVSTSANCGGQYVLGRPSAGGSRPMWAGVGGSAFHSFVEGYERLRAAEGGFASIETAWMSAFEEAIKTTEAEQAWCPRSAWYVANRGKENEDWWRVEGLEMCRTYVKATAAEMLHPIAPGRDGNPMIESRMEVKVAGEPFVAILDQVRYDHAGKRLIVVDVKAGSRKPTGPHQLVEYAHVLAVACGVSDDYRIDGAYYMARTGTTMLYENLRQIEDFAGFEYRVSVEQRKRAAHIYSFNVSHLCSSCGNSDRCPANAR